MRAAYHSEYRPGALDTSELDPCIAAETRLKKSPFSTRKKRTFCLIGVLILIFLLFLGLLIAFIASSNSAEPAEGPTDYDELEPKPIGELRLPPRPKGRDEPVRDPPAPPPRQHVPYAVKPEPEPRPANVLNLRPAASGRPLLNHVDILPAVVDKQTSTTTRAPTTTSTTRRPIPVKSTVAPKMTTTVASTTTTTSPPTTTSTTAKPTATTAAASKAKQQPADGEYTRKREVIMESCVDHASAGLGSGVYRIAPDGIRPAMDAYCQMETEVDPTDAGWTVVQRRDGVLPYFYNRSWSEYERGFGRVDGAHWLGLAAMRRMAPAESERQLGWTLRVELRGDTCDAAASASCSGLPDGYWWGEWDFGIGPAEDNYRLYVSPARGGNLTTHDGMDALHRSHSGKQFTTIDRDNDGNEMSNCAQIRNFGGWWHGDCGLIALNGMYGDRSSKLRYQVWYREVADEKIKYHIHPRQSLMMVRPRRV